MIIKLLVIIYLQEGFLLGDILHKETKTITDNDQQQINISKTIKINSLMPCPHPHFFYNGTGKVDKNKVKDFLKDQFDRVVAWYKFQKTSNLKFSLRDKIIHKQLIEVFGKTSDLFPCCLLINEISDNGATHLFSQAFIRYHNNRYDRIPMHIPNLSEPNNTYRLPEPSSQTFDKILRNLKIDEKKTQGLIVINKIHNALQKHIDTIIKNLSQAEEYLHELEEEVKTLEKRKLKKKKEEEKDKREALVANTKLEDNREKRKSVDINSSLSPEISPDIPKKTTQKPRGRGKPTIEVTRETHYGKA